MKQYESYKDSGIEWLGMIPSHWKVCKVKNLCSDIFAGGTPPTSIPTYWDGQIPWIPSGCCHDCNIDNAPKTITEEGLNNSSTRLIPANTTVMAMTGATCSFVGYLTFRACANQSVTAFIPKLNKIDSRFLFYLLQGMRKYILTFQTGGAQGGINVNDCQNLIIPHIPFEEQQIIAFYLDDKVGQIDAVIAEKEKMVEDLQNYRKSVISEAVTRGLNPDVPMKDSGIDWIGMIPEHWIVSKLKAFADVQTGSTPSTSVDKYWENPIEDWYTPSDFEDSDIQLKPSSRKLATIAFKEEACRVFDANTVFIVGIGATLGKVGISSKSCSANQQINAVTFKEKVLPLFGAYYLYSIKDTMKAVANAATLAIMNQSTTKDLPFICPPFEEQRSIVKAIDNKISVITNGVSELQSQIEDLKSYKSSLITEAVTGKIDLR